MKNTLFYLLSFALIFGACSLFKDVRKTNTSQSMMFLGDLGFGASYHARYEAKGKENILKTKGYGYPFEQIGAIANTADVTIANLETPLFSSCSTRLTGIKKYLHWCDTSAIVPVFEALDLEAVSLANNHLLDQETAGLDGTKKILKRFETAYFGAGDSLESAQPFSTIIDDRQVFVVGGFEYRKKYESTYDFYTDSKGKVGVNRWDSSTCIQQIKTLRDKYPEGFIVAYPHWGKDYKWKNKAQTSLAHHMIDAGADLVIGHGAHRIQEIELYRDKWILYGIGNFVFNTPGRYQKLDAPPYSIAVKLTFDEQATAGYHLECTPFFSDNRLTDYQPRFLYANELNELTDMLIEYSPDGLESYLKISESEGLFLIK